MQHTLVSYKHSCVCGKRTHIFVLETTPIEPERYVDFVTVAVYQVSEYERSHIGFEEFGRFRP